ncbi:MAG: hypothetical protein H0W70_09495, partial [Actinobacteria bacterium]|nr:hypothetical protein [Actinomycetota bacterium]
MKHRALVRVISIGVAYILLGITLFLLVVETPAGVSARDLFSAMLPSAIVLTLTVVPLASVVHSR